MSKAYYTLLVQYEKGDQWSAAFGDYDRDVVEQEKEDDYGDAHKARIVRTGDTQAAIDTEVTRMNSAQ